jgi:hypothetical protein
MVEGTMTWNKRAKNIKLTCKASYFGINTYYRKIKLISTITLIILYGLIYQYYINNIFIYTIILFYILYILLNIYPAYYLIFKVNLFHTNQHLTFLKSLAKNNHFKISTTDAKIRKPSIIFTDDISSLDTLPCFSTALLTRIDFDIEIVLQSKLVYERLEVCYNRYRYFYFSDFDFIYVVRRPVIIFALKAVYVACMFLGLCEVFEYLLLFCGNKYMVSFKRKVNEDKVMYIRPIQRRNDFEIVLQTATTEANQ